MALTTRLLDAVFPRPSEEHAELAGTELWEERDVRGWPSAHIVDHRNAQTTINLKITTDQMLTEDNWRTWEHTISGLPGLVAVCTVDEAGEGTWPHPRIAATFRAKDSSQRKHLDELVTDVSLIQSDLYERSIVDDGNAAPMEADEVIDALNHALGTSELSQWDELGVLPVSSRTDDLIINDEVSCSTFVVDISSEDVADELDAIMADWEGADRIRRARFFRPYVLPEGGEEIVQAGYGRHWALVTITGSPMADIAFRAAMDTRPAIGLRVRRLRGRQRTGLFAGLGIGVLGWQQIQAADRKAVAWDGTHE